MIMYIFFKLLYKKQMQEAERLRVKMMIKEKKQNRV